MNQQTAVEWLVSQLKIQGFLYDLDIEAAKSMEKGQIVKSYDSGYKACDLDEALEINKTMFSGKRYYKLKYNI